MSRHSSIPQALYFLPQYFRDLLWTLFRYRTFLGTLQWYPASASTLRTVEGEMLRPNEFATSTKGLQHSFFAAQMMACLPVFVSMPGWLDRPLFEVVPVLWYFLLMSYAVLCRMPNMAAALITVLPASIALIRQIFLGVSWTVNEFSLELIWRQFVESLS